MTSKSLLFLVFAVFFSNINGIHKTNDIYKIPWNFIHPTDPTQDSVLAKQMLKGIHYDDQIMKFDDEDLLVVQDIVKNIFSTYSTHNQDNGTLFFNSCSEAYTSKHQIFDEWMFIAIKGLEFFQMKDISKNQRPEAFTPILAKSRTIEPFSDESDYIKLDSTNLNQAIINPYCSETLDKKYPIASETEIKNLATENKPHKCFLTHYPVGTDMNEFYSRIPGKEKWKKDSHPQLQRSISFCKIECAGTDNCNEHEGNIIGYRCDTTGGSSGGPLFCKIDNEWKLTAIHVGIKSSVEDKISNNTKLHSKPLKKIKTNTLAVGSFISN